MEVVACPLQQQQSLKETASDLSLESGLVTITCISANTQQQRFKIVKIDRRLNNEGKVRDEVTGKITYTRGRWSVVDYYDVVPAPVTHETPQPQPQWHHHQVPQQPPQQQPAPAVPVAQNQIISQNQGQHAQLVSQVSVVNQATEHQQQQFVASSSPAAEDDLEKKEDDFKEKNDEVVSPESQHFQNHQQQQTDQQAHHISPHDNRAANATNLDTAAEQQHQQQVAPGTPSKQLFNLNRQPSQLSPQVSVQSPTKNESNPTGDTVAVEIVSAASEPSSTNPGAAIGNLATDNGAQQNDKETNKEEVKANGQSGVPNVAIDNKIEQAMDLVKSHLMFAVREEVEVLKVKIEELVDKIQALEVENNLLKSHIPPEVLSSLNLAPNSPQQQIQGGHPSPQTPAATAALPALVAESPATAAGVAMALTPEQQQQQVQNARVEPEVLSPADNNASVP